MPISAEFPVLTPWDQLSARLTPGAFLFSLAAPDLAEELRASLAPEGLTWVGWRQREALLREGRPNAQERYSSRAGTASPPLGDWLAPASRHWRVDDRGVAQPAVASARLERALRLCQLDGLTQRPVSLLSNGEAARACVAWALGTGPARLVLDDLCEGLDAGRTGHADGPGA